MNTYDTKMLVQVVKTAVRHRLKEISEDKKWLSGCFDSNGDWIHAIEMGNNYQSNIKRGMHAAHTCRTIFRTPLLQIFPEGAIGVTHKPTVTKLIVEALIIYQMTIQRLLSLYDFFKTKSETSWRSAPAEQHYEFEDCQHSVESLEKIFGTRDAEEIERIFTYLLSCRYNCSLQ